MNTQQDPTIPQYNEPPSHFEPSSVPPHKKRHRDGLRSAFSTILILIAAPLIALSLTAFVFQSYEVDGPSMEETLQNRDRLIVLKAEKTIARIFNKDYIPARGDIIVFVKSGSYESGSNSEKQLIKRVVGVPGDQVVIKEGLVTIFNTAHPSGYNPDTAGDYPRMDKFTSGEGTYVVGDDEVFVLGDNRANSLDSRSFGTIQAKDIVGRLAVRILPLRNVETY